MPTSKSRNGSLAAFSKPIHDHQWGTKNPIVIGMIWSTTKLRLFLGCGVWDAVTGEYIYYDPNPDLDLTDPPVQARQELAREA